MARPKGTSRETVATSVRLTPLCMRLWEQLASRAGLNKTAYLENTIRRQAKDEGIDAEATESDKQAIS